MIQKCDPYTKLFNTLSGVRIIIPRLVTVEYSWQQSRVWWYNRYIIYLFVCLTSTTEEPEGHLYCQRTTQIHVTKRTKRREKQTNNKQRSRSRSRGKCPPIAKIFRTMEEIGMAAKPTSVTEIAVSDMRHTHLAIMFTDCRNIP